MNLAYWRRAFLALIWMMSCANAWAGSVGFQEQTTLDERGEPIKLAIWYPGSSRAHKVSLGWTTQEVSMNGAMSEGRYPLIVISHGTGGTYFSHYDTAIALARAGFIAAAVMHPGDNAQDQSRRFFILERPGHIRRALDYLLRDWPRHAQVDAGRIGIFGFSAGGFTALVSIGGQPDMERIIPFCNEHSDHFACQLIAQERIAGRTANATMPAQLQAQDDRIKAAVIAAPALGFTFANRLQRATIPVQLWRAEDDRILPHPWYAEEVRRALPQAPQYHLVSHAGHFDFLAPCAPVMAQRLPDICSSATGFDRPTFHRAFNKEVVAFFQRTLEVEGH